MAFQLFTLPLAAGEAEIEAMNRFLRSHRVLHVERRPESATLLPASSGSGNFLRVILR
jgi:hypothetical protein